MKIEIANSIDDKFSHITACGGDCRGCEHYRNKSCIGCNSNGGRCVKMWSGRCEICMCCEKHSVQFCGLCNEFPCDWITAKIGEWNPDGIAHLKELADEYREPENTV